MGDSEERPKVIGVIGSRSRSSSDDHMAVLNGMTTAMNMLPDESIYTFVSGGCPVGGDNFAHLWALASGTPVWKVHPEGSTDLKRGHLNIHPALWDLYGRGAGFRRNTYIARDADWLIACVSVNRTGGTEDTIKKFLAKGPEFEERLILV